MLKVAFHAIWANVPETDFPLPAYLPRADVSTLRSTDRGTFLTTELLYDQQYSAFWSELSTT